MRLLLALALAALLAPAAQAASWTPPSVLLKGDEAALLQHRGPAGRPAAPGDRRLQARHRARVPGRPAVRRSAGRAARAGVGGTGRVRRRRQRRGGWLVDGDRVRRRRRDRGGRGDHRHRRRRGSRGLARGRGGGRVGGGVPAGLRGPGPLPRPGHGGVQRARPGRLRDDEAHARVGRDRRQRRGGRGVADQPLPVRSRGGGPAAGRRVLQGALHRPPGGLRAARGRPGRPGDPRRGPRRRAGRVGQAAGRGHAPEGQADRPRTGLRAGRGGGRAEPGRGGLDRGAASQPKRTGADLRGHPPHRHRRPRRHRRERRAGDRFLRRRGRRVGGGDQAQVAPRRGLPRRGCAVRRRPGTFRP